MIRALLIAALLSGPMALAGCASDGGRYPVLDVVHGPICGRAGAPAC